MENITPIAACEIEKLVAEQREKKLKEIPSKVIKIVNNLIIENWDISHNKSIVSQESIIDSLVEEGFEKNKIFQNGWLDFEDLYRQKGWYVYYYYDPSSPTFTFTKE